MNIISFLSKKRNALCFSLLCGLAYLGIVARFVLEHTANGGGLLITFFCPAIICGGALFIYKAIEAYIQSDSKMSLNILFWCHLIVILLSIALTLETFLV